MLTTDLIDSIEKDKLNSLNTLHFTNEFSKEELKHMQNALAMSESIKTIELENVEIKSDIWQMLGEALPLNNSVKSLKLNGLKNLLLHFPFFFNYEMQLKQ